MATRTPRSVDNIDWSDEAAYTEAVLSNIDEEDVATTPSSGEAVNAEAAAAEEEANPYGYPDGSESSRRHEQLQQRLHSPRAGDPPDEHSSRPAARTAASGPPTSASPARGGSKKKQSKTKASQKKRSSRKKVARQKTPEPEEDPYYPHGIDVVPKPANSPKLKLLKFSVGQRWRKAVRAVIFQNRMLKAMDKARTFARVRDYAIRRSKYSSVVKADAEARAIAKVKRRQRFAQLRRKASVLPGLALPKRIRSQLNRQTTGIQRKTGIAGLAERHPSVLERNPTQFVKQEMNADTFIPVEYTFTQMMLAKQKKEGNRYRGFVILPTSRRRMWFDVLVSIAILYTLWSVPLLITPFDIPETLYSVALAIDVLFVFDMVQSALTAYRDPLSLTGRMVVRPMAIAKHYVAGEHGVGWFWLDLIASFPFDLLFERHSATWRGLKCLKLLRVQRLYRNAKMSVLLGHIAHSPAFLTGGRIFKILLLFYYLMHCGGCFFTLLNETIMLPQYTSACFVSLQGLLGENPCGDDGTVEECTHTEKWYVRDENSTQDTLALFVACCLTGLH